LAELWIVEQLADDALALGGIGVEHKRSDVLGRGDVADDIEPDSPQVGGVVCAWGKLGGFAENFFGDQLIDLRRDLLGVGLGGGCLGRPSRQNCET
jgi:hypothetical protein